MLSFCDFIQVFVFTTNHHLKLGFGFAMPHIMIVYENVLKSGINLPQKTILSTVIPFIGEIPR